MRRLLPALFLFSMVPSLLFGQLLRDEEGFDVGAFRFRPVGEALGAYDNRVSEDTATGDFDGDFYGELAASLFIENRPARYDLSADAGYGYRFYQEYSDLDSDFYHAGAAIESVENPLKLGISSYLRKTLDYSRVFESADGDDSAAILSGSPSTRYTTRGNIAYEKRVAGKTTVTPGYDAWFYFQDFEDEDDAEWQVHRASLQVGYDYTVKTRLFLTGHYSLQINDEEDGKIGAVTAGAEGSMTDKGAWLAHLGVAAADYETSGTDQGFVGLLRADWAFTDKVSAYIFGTSSFQPGYSGGDARRVHRLGYGASWRILTRWALTGRVLHDYDEEISAAPGDNEEIKTFISVESTYDFTRYFALGASLEYIMDEEEEDQAIASLRAIFRY